MRDQDVGQCPAGILECLFHGGSLRGIDGRGAACLRVVNEHAEIVGEAIEKVCFCSHVGSVKGL